MYFESEESTEKVLLGRGFLLVVKGDNNVVTIGNTVHIFAKLANFCITKS